MYCTASYIISKTVTCSNENRLCVFLPQHVISFYCSRHSTILHACAFSAVPESPPKFCFSITFKTDEFISFAAQCQCMGQFYYSVESLQKAVQ